MSRRLSLQLYSTAKSMCFWAGGLQSIVLARSRTEQVRARARVVGESATNVLRMRIYRDFGGLVKLFFQRLIIYKVSTIK